jgi:hypothetical protein
MSILAMIIIKVKPMNYHDIITIESGKRSGSLVSGGLG